MLAWPAISLIKQQYPESAIVALVNKYTKPMAELCPWIDETLIDIEQGSSLSRSLQLAALIRNSRIDASISLYSTTHTALAIWLARVPFRTAPATKLAQVFYNHTLRQNRSRSEKPEYIYNVDLARYFITTIGNEPVELQDPPWLSFDPAEISALRREFTAEHNIQSTAKLVFVHPGSGGSAPSLDASQYAQLIDTLATDNDWYFVITAGPGEINLARQVADECQTVSKCVYESGKGLASFAKLLSIADMFISGSTGVLHIAGAMNVPTAAFYTRRQSATSLRWQTMNTPDKRIAISPPQSSEAENMQSIDAHDAAERIMQAGMI
jgi:ADP-heptose:LPS heptosyltransferase